MAGLFAARYETRHGHAPRMRRSCWSIDAPRWTACSLLWRLHVVHEFVFLKASVGTLREHCARLEGCFGACERFQKSFKRFTDTGAHGARAWQARPTTPVDYLNTVFMRGVPVFTI